VAHLAEPITLLFDCEPLDVDDAAEVRDALITVLAPTWSVAFRCGSVVSIEVETASGADPKAASFPARARPRGFEQPDETVGDWTGRSGRMCG
jgi:hypothetical protein